MTIEVDHVYKSYDGKTVLSDFSLDIESGKSYLISAPSGSGKTTLLRIILGLEKPDRGSIRLLGDYKYSGSQYRHGKPQDFHNLREGRAA